MHTNIKKDHTDNFACVSPFAQNHVFITDIHLQILLLCFKPLFPYTHWFPFISVQSKKYLADS